MGLRGLCDQGPGGLFERFAAERPVAVMFRGLLERTFSHERMNELFAATAVEQYDHRIAFATVVDLLSAVVTQQQASVSSAYRAASRERVGASLAAFYEKLAGVEPAVAEKLVSTTAAELAQVCDLAQPRRKPLLPGYRLRILDGKLLDGTEHRLDATRKQRDAVLPGRLCAMLDPDRELILNVAACEDAHAAERKLMPRAFALLEPGDCLLADRNFCTKGNVLSLQDRGIKFVIRQHRGDCEVEPLGQRKRLGRCATGIVYEEPVRVVHRDGRSCHLRRVTLELLKPTRDGDTVLHLLTNLPAKIGGRRIASLYRERWSIERAFAALAQALRGELNTLGYPRAALLGYCLALTAANLLSTVKACLRAAHGERAPKRYSTYYMGDEVSRAWDGIDLTIPAATWEKRFVRTTLPQCVQTLIAIAGNADPHRYATTTRGPKKPRTFLPKSPGGHRATHRLLNPSKHRE
jgi:hypothetical protein